MDQTITKVIKLGLQCAEVWENPHRGGMCKMVLNLHMNGHINESEKTQTINWIEEKIQNLGPSVKYLCDFLEEKLATKDDEKLRAAWVKWYKSAIRKRKKQHKK